jgi:hypothetical protein
MMYNFRHFRRKMEALADLRLERANVARAAKPRPRRWPGTRLCATLHLQSRPQGQEPRPHLAGPR